MMSCPSQDVTHEARFKPVTRSAWPNGSNSHTEKDPADDVGPTSSKNGSRNYKTWLSQI